MNKIRVLVVDDSLTVRKRMVEVLSAHPEFEVVGDAPDGKRGIELCTRLQPDVITLDMMMPVMSGLAATEYIMAYCPTPILIVSASMNRGELFRTYEALAAGAVDVLDKSQAGEDEEWEQKLISAVRMVSRIKVITHPRARLRLTPGTAPMQTAPSTPKPGAPTPKSGCRLIAIGASTGGPAAVLNILNALPENFPVPIVLLIHIGASFAVSFAEWLDSQSPLRVRYAQDGETLPQPGESRVVMAPAEVHLEVTQGKLRLTNGPPRHSCKPSVDVLFESLARECASHCAAALLTGMGRDGAVGLLAIRRAGGVTFAQDEATSVVFGMPREAILLGAAGRVLGLDDFAQAFCDLAGCEPRRAR